jgi:hypothetical protein
MRHVRDRQTITPAGRLASVRAVHTIRKPCLRACVNGPQLAIDKAGACLPRRCRLSVSDPATRRSFTNIPNNFKNGMYRQQQNKHGIKATCSMSPSLSWHRVGMNCSSKRRALNSGQNSLRRTLHTSRPQSYRNLHSRPRIVIRYACKD